MFLYSFRIIFVNFHCINDIEPLRIYDCVYYLYIVRTAKTPEKHKFVDKVESDSLSGHDSHIFVESFAESCKDEEIDSDYNIVCSVDSDLNSLQPLCLCDSEIKYKT